MLSVYKDDKYLQIRKSVRLKNTTGNNKVLIENSYFTIIMSDKP